MKVMLLVRAVRNIKDCSHSITADTGLNFGCDVMNGGAMTRMFRLNTDTKNSSLTNDIHTATL